MTDRAQNADFAAIRRFTPSSIWRARGTAENSRFSQRTEEFSQKTTGSRTMGSVSLGPLPSPRPYKLESYCNKNARRTSGPKSMKYSFSGGHSAPGTAIAVTGLKIWGITPLKNITYITKFVFGLITSFSCSPLRVKNYTWKAWFLCVIDGVGHSIEKFWGR